MLCVWEMLEQMFRQIAIKSHQRSLKIHLDTLQGFFYVMDPFKQLSAAVPACDQRVCCAYGWHAPAESVGQGPLTEADRSQSSPV